jgi:hypothetical protein
MFCCVLTAGRNEVGTIILVWAGNRKSRLLSLLLLYIRKYIKIIFKTINSFVTAIFSGFISTQDRVHKQAECEQISFRHSIIEHIYHQEKISPLFYDISEWRISLYTHGMEMSKHQDYIYHYNSLTSPFTKYLS